MRIGANILFYNGNCYQSYGWQQLRPLGKLQHAINMLESYHIDEISIIRPIRDILDDKQFQADIAHLQQLKSMTPISFGGGIRSKTDLQHLYKLPIERLVFSSAFIAQNTALIKAATETYGRQAMQALLPVSIQDGQTCVFHCQQNQWQSLSKEHLEFCSRYANETIIYDAANEGFSDAFNWKLLDTVFLNNNQLILSGGIGKETSLSARNKGFASVLIENRILHHEYSVGRYKHA